MMRSIAELQTLLPDAAERRRYAILQAASAMIPEGYTVETAVNRAEEALRVIENKEKQPA